MARLVQMIRSFKLAVRFFYLVLALLESILTTYAQLMAYLLEAWATAVTVLIQENLDMISLRISVPR